MTSVAARDRALPDDGKRYEVIGGSPIVPNGC
jgi:hypothetical protein